MKLLIRSARIIDPASGADFLGDILISDGKIAEIGSGLPLPEGTREISAAGLVAAPGLVDMHVHLRDPGQTEKEDIFSGCRAAAAGGVTSLLCMPNTVPAVDSPETVRQIREKAKTADVHVYVAAAISKGLGGKEPSDWRALREAGAVALSDDGRPVLKSSLMAAAMKAAPKLGLAVCAHCEDLSLSSGGKMNEGAVSKELGVKGVPAAAEDCGAAREIALAAAYNVPVHICHVSTKNSVAMIRDAKRRGVPVTAETAPHYFALTEQELRKRDADYRMSPPLRTEEDRLAVCEGLRDGTIDAIATDHAPHTPQEKADFLFAPNGAIGMETSLAAGITFLVERGVLTLLQLLRLMTISPARILGIPAGTLQKGVDADIVLFDPKEKWTVCPEKLHGKSRNAVFKGRELVGRVKLTVCGGRIVYNGMS
ncbi:MAG: Dihydroorotase [Thermocaproicibacter melissae]|jgi:dihydroorotase|uniref:dihydroorotase n=1 Tax=Thermocaproicibacter melissae TaxID=2966552 RepID=UPI0024B18AFC|nr:dihydroorotase [Thermocaproicibacter melissae]WBY64198.1 dihydroorotase [Thermocaproicibacter melissae]